MRQASLAALPGPAAGVQQGDAPRLPRPMTPARPGRLHRERPRRASLRSQRLHGGRAGAVRGEWLRRRVRSVSPGQRLSRRLSCRPAGLPSCWPAVPCWPPRRGPGRRSLASASAVARLQDTTQSVGPDQQGLQRLARPHARSPHRASRLASQPQRRQLHPACCSCRPGPTVWRAGLALHRDVRGFATACAHSPRTRTWHAVRRRPAPISCVPPPRPVSSAARPEIGIPAAARLLPACWTRRFMTLALHPRPRPPRCAQLAGAQRTRSSHPHRR